MKKLITKSFLALFGLMLFANLATAQTVFFQDDFESGNLDKWTVIDSDGDGNIWHASNSAIITPHSGFYYACSYSWNGATYYPDNWMITPDVTGATSVQYYVSSSIAYPDHYAVMASTTGNAIEDFTVVFEETVSATKQGAEGVKNSSKNTRGWIERNVTLPEGTKYVAFRHYNSAGKNYLIIDDVSVISGGGGTPDVNMWRWIELTVKQGQRITLDILADAENTGVKVVSGTYDTTLIVGTSWSDYIDYYAQGSKMKIYGNVKEFDCSYNNENITSLDASNNTKLKTVYCFANNISTIKVSGCDSLNYIDCSGNNLSACGLDSIFHQLPKRPADNKGEIIIREGDAYDQPGAFSCRDTIATSRNWDVFDGSTPIVNTTYACPDFTIIEEMSANSLEINIYPNPAKDNLNIECGEKIDNLELYDALGRMLIRKENVLDNTSVDVSNLNSGIYVLKIRTEKGSGEYKVIVN